MSHPSLGSLVDALAAHEPWDDAEKADLAGLLRLLRSGGNPFPRTLYRPGHVTVSGFVLDPDGHSVALVEHLRLGRWLQPGGHVESGDATPEAGARREIAEETGITSLGPLGLLDVDVHAYPESRDEPPHLHFDVRWGYRTDDVRLSSGGGVGRVRWVALSDAAAMDESIARPVRKLVTRGW